MLLCLSSSPVFPLVVDPPAINLLPTPALLSGALDDTPQAVTLCAPLRIQYSVKNTGALPDSAGSLTIEIKAAGTGQLVFSRQLPFTTETKSIRIENVSFPQGAYTITLKASAMDQEHGTTREAALAEQALTVSAPIQVKKGGNASPRVLLWLSRNGTAVQQAFAEQIVKQAFEDDGVYYTIADTAADFTNQALSGVFNTVVLFETDELLEQPDWLMDRIARGQGIVIIGSEDRARMFAETFGFKFSEALPAAGAMLLLTEESGMGLSGTIPVSGRVLLPQKKSARPAALFAADKKPAVLIDKTGSGRVIVMPFSFTRSSLEAGTTSQYSLLLRAAVRNAAPSNDEQIGVYPIELLVSAPEGPVRTRVVESLPPGTRVIWTNNEGTVKNNSILFDLIADKEPQKLLYLYQTPAVSKTPAFTEVFFECNEKLMSQGKIE